MKVVLIIILLGLFALVFHWLAKDTEWTMTKCQITHSYDTCFYILNR